jgi:hypothetical protein
MRIRRTRKLDRSWIAVLAGGLGVYALLAVGFHRVVEPAILASHSRLPTERLIASRYTPSEEPATSGRALRNAVQIPVRTSEPPRPVDALAKADPVDIKAADIKTPETKAPEIKVPKRESPRRQETRRSNERPVQQTPERRGFASGFSSSPASPDYR